MPGRRRGTLERDPALLPARPCRASLDCQIRPVASTGSGECAAPADCLTIRSQVRSDCLGAFRRGGERVRRGVDGLARTSRCGAARRATFLAATFSRAGYDVVEAARMDARAHRGTGKSDPLDARGCRGSMNVPPSRPCSPSLRGFEQRRPAGTWRSSYRRAAAPPRLAASVRRRSSSGQASARFCPRVSSPR
ncbi:hypothetical protein E1218_34580 [Kribbella turkmenica]|uniref:Uncharacterized protein n=1 Tax=Kribbella turkmenica TaxID=2530375 RepID=A0A4R4W621_9ACTN|nr:hypothetical protein E1218_34580 [Kribbella turkmenica]